MAKKSAVLKNERRKKLIACYVAKYGTLKARVRDESLPQGDRVLVRLRIAKNPARRQPYPGPQPVRTHRSAAGLSPQIPARPRHAARPYRPWTDPGRPQIELVGSVCA